MICCYENNIRLKITCKQKFHHNQLILTKLFQMDPFQFSHPAVVGP